MPSMPQTSVKSNSLLLLQFSLSIAALLMLLAWVFSVSFLTSLNIVLAVIVVLLLLSVMLLVDRVERLEKSRQYRVTRIYNKEGKEVMNRWTDQINSGHWVTITTDLINHDVLYAEHSRTDENTNAVGRENCIREDHEYNRSAVWGEHYQGPEYKVRIDP